MLFVILTVIFFRHKGKALIILNLAQFILGYACKDHLRETTMEKSYNDNFLLLGSWENFIVKYSVKSRLL